MFRFAGAGPKSNAIIPHAFRGETQLLSTNGLFVKPSELAVEGAVKHGLKEVI
jgi:hypothetical protein